jgi:hypothetical protein
MSLVTKTNAGQIARRGALALSRLVLPDGRFIYRYRQSKGPQQGKKYNALRHCGAAWAMLDVVRHQDSLVAVMEAANRAVHYLIGNYLMPFGETDGLSVVDEGTIKLGGGGLALLALTDLFKSTGDDELLSVARRIGEYIQAEQKDDGDFVHSRGFAGEERAFRSDYYTGEALFGLMCLHDASGESKWLDSVVRSEAELFKRSYGVFSQSHWMLYALDRLHAVRPLDIYLEHARQIAENIILFSDYRRANRSTPTACRSEGLLAYYRMLKRTSASGISPSAVECLRVIRENLVLQTRFLTPGGEFVRGAGNDEVRIDYIQHNISAFLAYSLAAT